MLRRLAAAVALLSLASTAHATGLRKFQKLQPGVFYATFASNYNGPVGVTDARLHVVRVDPQQARLVALATSALDRKTRTALQWTKDHKLAVAINLGMYQNNHSTHVGHLRIGGHVNSARWTSTYASLLAFHPRKRRLPAAVMADRSAATQRHLLGSYAVVVQNLRLIRGSTDGTGVSVWSRRRTRRWSEAAVASDRRGRLLLLFCRAPLTMWEFNRLLLSLPLNVVRAAHLEGGPEASLSIHAGGVNLDLAGSFETGFLPSDSNRAQWPIPNVLGVAKSGRDR